MILTDDDLAGRVAPSGLEARLLRIPPEEYHADPAPAPSLSSSLARTLINRSALHAHHEHPRLGGARVAPTATQDRGALIHRLILGKGADIVPVEARDWRTKAAKAAREEAHRAGMIPVLAARLRAAQRAADAIGAKLARRGVELRGESEVAILWQEAAADGPVWCRALLDHVLLEEGVIYDLKSAEDASLVACSRTAIAFGYPVQAAAYTRALTALRPDLGGRVRFEMLFVEHEPPYAVTQGRMPGVLREYGERFWIKAVETWSSCLRHDRWNEPTDGPVYLEPPGWFASQMGEMLE